MKGYKATDKDGRCRGYQFDLPTQRKDGTWKPGKWHTHDGELAMCESGFHFCEQPSGPWVYYPEDGTRIFEVEADDVADEPWKPGADRKRVCRRIRLLREIAIDGDGNTGNGNTGDGNTGYGNATDRACGFFCVEPQTVRSFDVPASLTYDEFVREYPECIDLGRALGSEEPIPFEPYKRIPGITPEKLAALHAKHLEGRK